MHHQWPRGGPGAQPAGHPPHEDDVPIVPIASARPIGGSYSQHGEALITSRQQQEAARAANYNQDPVHYDQFHVVAPNYPARSAGGPYPGMVDRSYPHPDAAYNQGRGHLQQGDHGVNYNYNSGGGLWANHDSGGVGVGDSGSLSSQVARGAAWNYTDITMGQLQQQVQGVTPNDHYGYPLQASSSASHKTQHSSATQEEEVEDPKKKLEKMRAASRASSSKHRQKKTAQFQEAMDEIQRHRHDRQRRLDSQAHAENVIRMKNETLIARERNAQLAANESQKLSNEKDKNAQSASVTHHKLSNQDNANSRSTTLVGGTAGNTSEAIQRASAEQAGPINDKSQTKTVNFALSSLSLAYGDVAAAAANTGESLAEEDTTPAPPTRLFSAAAPSVGVAGNSADDDGVADTGSLSEGAYMHAARSLSSAAEAAKLWAQKTAPPSGDHKEEGAAAGQDGGADRLSSVARKAAPPRVAENDASRKDDGVAGQQDYEVAGAAAPVTAVAKFSLRGQGAIKPEEAEKFAAFIREKLDQLRRETGATVISVSLDLSGRSPTRKFLENVSSALKEVPGVQVRRLLASSILDRSLDSEEQREVFKFLVREFIVGNHNLKDADLSDNAIGSTLYHDILVPVLSSSVVHANFTNCGLEDGAMVLLHEKVKRQLLSLKLESNNLGVRGGAFLSEYLKCYPGIETLHLGASKSTGSENAGHAGHAGTTLVLEQMAQSAQENGGSNLKNLVVSDVDMRESTKHLAKLLKHSPGLTRLSTPQAIFRTNLKKYKKNGFSGVPPNVGVETVLKNMHEGCQLKTLGMDGVCCTKSTAMPGVLSRSTDLTVLSLHCMDSGQTMDVCMALTPGSLGDRRSLEVVDFSGCNFARVRPNQFQQFCRANNAIESLVLGAAKKLSAEHLAGLSELRALKTFQAQACKLKAAGASVLLDLLNNRPVFDGVERFEIGRNKFSEQDVYPIARALIRKGAPVTVKWAKDWIVKGLARKGWVGPDDIEQKKTDWLVRSRQAERKGEGMQGAIEFIRFKFGFTEKDYLEFLHESAYNVSHESWDGLQMEEDDNPLIIVEKLFAKLNQVLKDPSEEVGDLMDDLRKALDSKIPDDDEDDEEDEDEDSDDDEEEEDDEDSDDEDSDDEDNDDEENGVDGAAADDDDDDDHDDDDDEAVDDEDEDEEDEEDNDEEENRRTDASADQDGGAVEPAQAPVAENGGVDDPVDGAEAPAAVAPEGDEEGEENGGMDDDGGEAPAADLGFREGEEGHHQGQLGTGESFWVFPGVDTASGQKRLLYRIQPLAGNQIEFTARPPVKKPYCQLCLKGGAEPCWWHGTN